MVGLELRLKSEGEGESEVDGEKIGWLAADVTGQDTRSIHGIYTTIYTVDYYSINERSYIVSKCRVVFSNLFIAHR